MGRTASQWSCWTDLNSSVCQVIIPYIMQLLHCFTLLSHAGSIGTSSYWRADQNTQCNFGPVLQGIFYAVFLQVGWGCWTEVLAQLIKKTSNRTDTPLVTTQILWCRTCFSIELQAILYPAKVLVRCSTVVSNLFNSVASHFAWNLSPVLRLWRGGGRQ